MISRALVIRDISACIVGGGVCRKSKKLALVTTKTKVQSPNH
ncbi:hypothetical protein VCHENC01_1544 [Vibrio harveyi]|nr:hypothetical protein VCHENC01_1544 [Vibrio harveyi]